MRDLIIDCFAGGGGASIGIEMALGRQVDIAINHDSQAIRMHEVNHPDTLHLTEDIFKVDLQKYVKDRKVALMWASPDCTSHSKAKGGQPRMKGLRILPWAVYKHARVILPDVIIMENVEEIQQWGPLDESGYPIPERKGEDYRRFVTAMKSLGYDFDSRELVAADYGAPTTRKRWYAIFRRDGRPIVWPKQTHNKSGTDGLKKWEPIWKYLDLTDTGKSIFSRKKPLAVKTMNRIARGMEKFVFRCPEPFIVHYKFDNAPESINEPLSTITSVNGHYLCIPYIMQIGQTGFCKDRNRGVDEPISTVVTKNEHCLISPLLIQYHSETTKSGIRGQAVTEPIQTIDTSNRYGLVSAFITKFYKSGIGQGMDEPLHTITTSSGHFGQVSILAVDKKHLQEAGMDEEVVQKAIWVSQFIMEYYGCGTGQPVTEPLHTVVTKDRFALITVLGNEYVIVDIYLRMLKPRELMMGQGFPPDYIIDRDAAGKKYPVCEQVARIGNSVVPIMAQALVAANCGYLKVGDRMPNMQIDDSEAQLKFA